MAVTRRQSQYSCGFGPAAAGFAARLADYVLARSTSESAARLPLRRMLIGAGRGQVIGSPIGPSIMLADKGPSHAIILQRGIRAAQSRGRPPSASPKVKGAQRRGSTAVPRCGISLIVILCVLKSRRLRPTRHNKLACREPAALISMFKGRRSEHCPSRSAPAAVRPRTTDNRRPAQIPRKQ